MWLNVKSLLLEAPKGTPFGRSLPVYDTTHFDSEDDYIVFVFFAEYQLY